MKPVMKEIPILPTFLITMTDGAEWVMNAPSLVTALRHLNVGGSGFVKVGDAGLASKHIIRVEPYTKPTAEMRAMEDRKAERLIKSNEGGTI